MLEYAREARWGACSHRPVIRLFPIPCSVSGDQWDGLPSSRRSPSPSGVNKGQMGTLDFNLQAVMIRQCPSSPCKSGVKITHSNPVKQKTQGFPGGLNVGDLPANVGDTSSIPGPGRPHMPQSN